MRIAIFTLACIPNSFSLVASPNSRRIAVDLDQVRAVTEQDLGAVCVTNIWQNDSDVPFSVTETFDIVVAKWKGHEQS
jgi:hypothetical protein